MPSGHVERIDDLRRMDFALKKLGQEWLDAVEQAELILRGFRQFVLEERQQYWRHQVLLAERRMRAAQEALSRTRITDDPRTSRGTTEARKAAEQAKLRLRFCEQKLAICRNWAVELDRNIERFVVELSRIRDIAGRDLPSASGWLKKLIADLDLYAETQQPTKPGS